MHLNKRFTYWLGIVLLLTGFCGASALMLMELRRDSWTLASNGAQNLLAVLSQDIESNIRSYDRALSTVVTKLQEPGFADLDPDLQQKYLFGGTSIGPYFASLLVLDKNGNVVRDAHAVPSRVDNFSDRAYFRVHARNEAFGLFISPPFQRRLTGHDEVIGLSRRITASDGSFSGVVVGTLRLDYFRQLFERAHLNPGDAINLLSQSGIVLMRSPYQPEQIGRDLSGTDNVRRFQSTTEGTFSGVAAIDGVTRVYHFTHVGDLPLILNVALDRDTIFASWRTQAIIIGALLVLLCALTFSLGLVVRREFKRRSLAEMRTRESEAQYRLLADHATDLILRLDRDLTRRYVSPASSKMLGFEPDELFGRKTRELVHPDDWPLVEAMVTETRVSGLPAEAIYRLKHRDGHFIWVEGRYSLVEEDCGFIVVLRDISARKSAELKLAAVHDELARHALLDGLTGLANRRRFDEGFKSELERSEEVGKPLSLLLIDVDHFKLFNDTYGHQAGDECLRRVAQAIKSCTRPSDLCARYGGEEIAVVLPGSDGTTAIQVGERIRKAVEQLDIPHASSKNGHVTISVGCATREMSSAKDAEQLLGQADRLLYEAKRTGRNQVLSAGLMASRSQTPVLLHEERRLAAVEACRETIAVRGSAEFDLLARSASHLLNAPIGFITLVGQDEVTVVGRYGIAANEVPRDISFCAHTVAGTEPLIVNDTLSDIRFYNNPLSHGESGLRFYAGAPITDPHSGETIGAICVADTKPRATGSERQVLKSFSELAIARLR